MQQSVTREVYQRKSILNPLGAKRYVPYYTDPETDYRKWYQRPKRPDSKSMKITEFI